MDIAHDRVPFSELAREKRLAALHRELSVEMGFAEFRGEAALHGALETALWHLGHGVEVAAHLTALARPSS